MVSPENLCGAVSARDRHRRRLKQAKGTVVTVPWYRFSEKRYQKEQIRERIAEIESQIASYESQITPEAVNGAAHLAATELWAKGAASLIPNKHRYGRAAQAEFARILQAALAARSDYEFTFGIGGATKYRLDEQPEVNECLTEEFVSSAVRDAMADHQAIAASTNFINKQFADLEGHRVIIVQHVESSMRARFVQNGNGFGSVYSKSDDIDSIDPENPGRPALWERYLGLGIGRGIYAEAQRLTPEVRWQNSAFSDHSRALRKKLHAADPYIWDGHCSWCGENLPLQGIDWMQATRTSFDAHP